MKNVILCAAALVFGTVAFAQVGGAPTANTPVTNMSANPNANIGESVQTGNENKVRVRQAGSRNSVYTNQDDGSGTGGNLGIIMQTGDVGPLSGFANAAELRQSGSVNESTMVQAGNRNNAITLQGQGGAPGDDASSGNKARIQQGSGLAEFNFAAIEQNGATNQATTVQGFDNNDAYTIQDGDRNGSMIVQNGGPDDTAGHNALNEQYGNDNQSAIDQRGAGARNNARTIQVGNSNQAKQIQNTIASNGAQGEKGLINQGDDATFQNVAQTLDNQNLYTELSAISNINFGGNGGTSTGSVAYQTQNGKMSAAEIHQFDDGISGGNYAEQLQDGWNQDALITQNAAGNATGNNYARQEQHNDNNEAAIGQVGINNKAYQFQDGKRNLALSAQAGNGNLVNTHQFGNDNVAHTEQRTVGNRALIVQRGGQSYSSSQIGRRNQVDALQLGPNGNFDTDGVICDFDMEIPYDMDFDVPDLTIDNICPDC